MGLGRDYYLLGKFTGAGLGIGKRVDMNLDGLDSWADTITSVFEIDAH